MENSEEFTSQEKSVCQTIVNFLHRRDYEVLDDGFKYEMRCFVVAKDADEDTLVFVNVIYTDMQPNNDHLVRGLGSLAGQAPRQSFELASLAWLEAHAGVVDKSIRIRFDRVHLTILGNGCATLRHQIDVLSKSSDDELL